jgi:hypothetical protein
MRTKYETEEDLKNEKLIMESVLVSYKRLKQLHDVFYVKLNPYKYNLDYLLIDKNKNGLGWIEVKKRNIMSFDYKEYTISLSKVLKGLELSKATKLPFYLVVNFKNGIYSCKVEEHGFRVAYGGRTLTTRDSDDIEPVAKIDINKFKSIDL